MDENTAQLLEEKARLSVNIINLQHQIQDLALRRKQIELMLQGKKNDSV